LLWEHGGILLIYVRASGGKTCRRLHRLLEIIEKNRTAIVAGTAMQKQAQSRRMGLFIFGKVKSVLNYIYNAEKRPLLNPDVRGVVCMFASQDIL